ncbi:hypothetical protein E2986_12277 [Frieseomelitta varia]|uniref:Carboxylesterase type B domain-containing protein n=1 Tax=Frieseomelitta varia TaxID=561572 RepID=A0A833S6N8_9HYME|nr:hypothetical protein E2986_12277 [Frieseomelitta varia]
MACENTVIRVKQGRLRGIIEKTSYGDEYLAFRGIPYAKPPLGPLRFKIGILLDSTSPDLLMMIILFKSIRTLFIHYADFHAFTGN